MPTRSTPPPRAGAYTSNVMLVCSSCGQENPDVARFCMACAQPLTAVPPIGHARKILTIVFCDVVGFTPMGDELDPETVRAVMTRFFEEMRDGLQRHGGTVEKYIGDAVMAVFGIPKLHEDDALRALRAAADMRNALTSLNEDLERTVGVSITTRTGVSTGEVLVSGAAIGPAVVGDAVNVAARLQQAAAPGEILLGRETYQLVRDQVSVDEASSLVLKGKRFPVTAYRLLDISAVSEPPRRVTPALVGRSDELHTLQKTFEGMRSNRDCRLICVIGAAGAGKSRLASEFLAGIEDEAVAIWGRCLPYGDGITFWPIAEAIRQLAGIDADDPLEIARSKLEVLLQGADGSAVLFDRVAAATGLADVTAGLPETYWAIRRLLEQVAKDEPLVLVLDDLQWAEPALLDLVDYLVRSSREAPILLLCLARGELLEAIRMGHATPRRDDAAPVAARRRRDERPDRRAAPWRRSRERGQGTDLGGGRRESPVRRGDVQDAPRRRSPRVRQGKRGPGPVGRLIDGPADDPRPARSAPRSTLRRGTGGDPRRGRDGEGLLLVGRARPRPRSTPPPGRSLPPEPRSSRADRARSHRRLRRGCVRVPSPAGPGSCLPSDPEGAARPSSTNASRPGSSEPPAIGSGRTRRSSPTTSSRRRGTASSWDAPTT